MPTAAVIYLSRFSNMRSRYRSEVRRRVIYLFSQTFYDALMTPFLAVIYTCIDWPTR